jgi:hypothetical protein
MSADASNDAAVAVYRPNEFWRLRSRPKARFLPVATALRASSFKSHRRTKQALASPKK